MKNNWHFLTLQVVLKLNWADRWNICSKGLGIISKETKLRKENNV